MKILKFHLIQLMKSYQTRSVRGDMDFITYHCFRINRLWEMRFSNKDFNHDI